MRWLLALHIIFMVTWFAGLFYLPRLFAYHADAQDKISIERFKIMERRLFYAIMTPGAILTLFFGLSLLTLHPAMYLHSGWMHAKLSLVASLVAYHLYCRKLILDFQQDRNTKSAKFYRWFNEFPSIVLIAVVILVVVKPF